MIYNTLYNTLIRLNEYEYNVYDQVIMNDSEVEKILVDNCLWIEADIDEKAKYIACAEAYTLYVPRP